MKSIRPTSFVLLAGMSVLSFGCVTVQDYDRSLASNRVLKERVEDLELKLAARDTALNDIQKRRDANAAVAKQLESENAELRLGLAKLSADYEKLSGQTPEVIYTGAGIAADVNEELINLAQNNSDLMTYDPALGMIRLKSDLTFATGSANVNDGAQGALGRLAKVLSKGSASIYEIKVVGHTDNVPMRNPRNVERYGDNWGLSAARARSVAEVVIREGIAPERMEIAGRGEFDPMTSNDTNAGRGANRRVEIFLRNPTRSNAPSERHSASSSSVSSNVVEEAPAARPPRNVPMK